MAFVAEITPPMGSFDANIDTLKDGLPHALCIRLDFYRGITSSSLSFEGG
jgi:hypothetical protein